MPFFGMDMGTTLVFRLTALFLFSLFICLPTGFIAKGYAPVVFAFIRSLVKSFPDMSTQSFAEVLGKCPQHLSEKYAIRLGVIQIFYYRNQTYSIPAQNL
ncbi:MAG: hypothetical protein A9181_06970 [Dehalococcoides mccartyi]|nr:MAG: hypothetical protein A9181_06970 [Dehalococcoides mccartyi]